MTRTKTIAMLLVLIATIITTPLAAGVVANVLTVNLGTFTAEKTPEHIIITAAYLLNLTDDGDILEAHINGDGHSVTFSASHFAVGETKQLQILLTNTGNTDGMVTSAKFANLGTFTVTAVGADPNDGFAIPAGNTLQLTWNINATDVAIETPTLTIGTT